MTGLVQTMDQVSELLGRRLLVDELVVLGRMHDAGRAAEQIAEMLRDRPSDVGDEELVTRRAEVRGRRVVGIE